MHPATNWLTLLQQHRAIAVIRAPEFSIGQTMAKTVIQAGMRLIEITWDSDRPGDLISHLRQTYPHCTIGTGTLFTTLDLQAAIAAGSQFAFTPSCNPSLIEQAIAHDIPMIPGALTPTEIVTAWQAGAAAVKVFPISAMGGAHYLQALRDPLRAVPLIPTGGVTVENAIDMLQAGATAIGLSSSLFPKQAIATQDWEKITQLTQILHHQIAPTCH
ncbi:MAG: bifunctional 4-hydroxy-2-oxoglutarate aldolase/2-dehydro-3-deoxy-phosphogluconate aldolase [Synechococcales bacterium]|nr:bifunctional 4-hydroxy-2-oxoglutarate aldolase/2-dehydro-3-deoxy-phosphogluconate aldolase [Synechococcales bacterium]